MKSVSVFLFFAMISLRGLSQQADSNAIITLLKNDYKALANLDAQKHLAYCTEDYLLIENGEIWTLQKEIELLYDPKTNSGKERKDEFTFQKVEINGSYAYAVYELKSVITRNGVAKYFHWTETAIFTKQEKTWKIKLIHSTKISSH